MVWAVVPILLGVYLLTMSPTVGLIDSGELAAGCYLLNILHPTGYPLWTMLGRLATLVPLGRVVNRVAVMSGLLAATGVGLFLLLGQKLGLGPSAVGGAALVLGLSVPVWAVAVDVEVYSLTLVLAVLVFWAAEGVDTARGLLLFAYLAGLSLTNHMSGLSVVLGAALAVLGKLGRSFWRRLPVLILFGLLGLSPYLFLIIRARAGPLFAWGNPVNLERFWWHVTGRQYQVWMFSLPMAEVVRNAGRGLGIIARSFGFVLLVPVLIGVYRLVKTRLSLALGLLATVFLSFFYAINYSISDIESYYIPCVLGLALFCAVGLDSLRALVRPLQHLGWVVGLVLLIVNFNSLGRQGDYVAYDEAMNTLASTESNAIIITDWWDLYAPVFYLQNVEKVRPDVCIVDKELVRRSWYLNYLAKAYPWLIERSKPELERYRSYLDQFEHNRLKDPEAIQACFIVLLRSFVLRNPERPAYTTIFPESGRDGRELLAGFRLVPVGLLLQIREDSLIPEFDWTRLRVRIPRLRLDERTRANLERYRRFALLRARLLTELGQGQEAQAVLNWLRTAFEPLEAGH
ncbi:MAG: DUF2723 domain-containing protein [candidate division WOR-3 bacterium]